MAAIAPHCGKYGACSRQRANFSPQRSVQAWSLRNGVGAIDRVQKRIGEGVGLSEVLGPARYGPDRMIGGERADRGAKRLQLLVIRANPQQAAVFLHHVDARTAVRRIDHDV